MATITLGSRYVIDETAALQNFALGANSPSVGDADFNVSTLPAAFKSRLDCDRCELPGLRHGQWHRPKRGGVIQVTSPGPIESLVLADSANGTLNGDPAISTGGSPILTLGRQPSLPLRRSGQSARRIRPRGQRRRAASRSSHRQCRFRDLPRSQRPQHHHCQRQAVDGALTSRSGIRRAIPTRWSISATRSRSARPATW